VKRAMGMDIPPGRIRMLKRKPTQLDNAEEGKRLPELCLELLSETEKDLAGPPAGLRVAPGYQGEGRLVPGIFRPSPAQSRKNQEHPRRRRSDKRQ